MNLKEYYRVKLSITGLLVITLFFLYGCTEKPSGHTLSNLEDSAVFKIYVQGSLIGTVDNSIDLKGNYHRKVSITLEGKRLEMSMSITPDRFGDWKIIDSQNTLVGDIRARRERNRADIFNKGEKRTVELPPGDYVYFDDFGNLLESVMLKNYDMDKKGKQVFRRFRIPEVPGLGGYTLDIEVEFVERQVKTVAGKQWEFLIFNIKALGITAQYWVDKDYKIYLTNASVQNVVSVREGFEELLPK